jgi:hypothetical protein
MPDSTVSLVAPYPTLELTTASDQVVVELTSPDSILAVTAASGNVATVEVETEVQDAVLYISAAAGGVSTVELEAPSPSLDLSTGATVELVGESALDVISVTGGVASVSLTAPQATLGIDGEGDEVAFVSLQPSLPTLAVSAASGNVAQVELEAIPPTLLIPAGAIGESQVALVAPLPVLGVSAATGIVSTITLIAPEPDLVITTELDAALAGIFAAWCMNVESTKVSTYAQFPFNALVRYGGQHFGVAADGIYLLEGVDDAGADINAELKFGYDDFGSDQFKRVPHVYVGCKAEGNLQFTLSVDGKPEYATSFSPEEEGIHNTRVKPGRGHRGRYWQPGLLNVAGVDFEIASLSLIEEVLQRRVS